ncbi:MAG: ABC transporter substrate-binding protein [Litoreibacter sp.]
MTYHWKLKIIATTALLMANPATAEIKIGSILDQTGFLNVYGLQQDKALRLAIESINKDGGLLGETIVVESLDAESDGEKYEKLAEQHASDSDIVAAFGGLTSSSREAMRPVFRDANKPYFYSALYEGGACDRQTFITGSSASQQLDPLIGWAIDYYGPDIYVMAPNYNFGEITGIWVEYLANQYGGYVIDQELLPLDQTDYSATIENIRKANPDFVVTLPVGPSQVGFIQQLKDAGLPESMGIVSTNYGSSNEQLLLTSEARDGIVSSLGYFQEVDSETNDAFVSVWKEAYGDETPITTVAVDVWNAVHIWAAAVKIAGTSSADEVFDALQTGNIAFDAPNGTVTLEGGSHHLRQDIYLARGNAEGGFEVFETYRDVLPYYEREHCDLISNPELVEHFTPE